MRGWIQAPEERASNGQAQAGYKLLCNRLQFVAHALLDQRKMDSFAVCRPLVTFVEVARRIGQRLAGPSEFGSDPQHRHHPLRIERTAAREAFTLAEQRVDVPPRGVLGHV